MGSGSIYPAGMNAAQMRPQQPTQYYGVTDPTAGIFNGLESLMPQGQGQLAPQQAYGQIQQHEKPGFFSKLGASVKGIANVPGKIAESLVDTVTDPKKLLKTAALVGACFIPGVGPAVAAGLPAVEAGLIGYGLYQGGKTALQGAGQVAQGWSNDNLQQIEDGSTNFGVGAAATAASVYGAKAHIRSQVANNSAAVGAKNGVATIHPGFISKTLSKIKQFFVGGEGVKSRTVAANDIGKLDALRLLGQEYKYGFGVAKDAIKGKFANSTATTAQAAQSGTANAANNAATEAAKAGASAPPKIEVTVKNPPVEITDINKRFISGEVPLDRRLTSGDGLTVYTRYDYNAFRPTAFDQVKARVGQAYQNARTQAGETYSGTKANAQSFGEQVKAQRPEGFDSLSRTKRYVTDAQNATKLYNQQYPGMLPATGAVMLNQPIEDEQVNPFTTGGPQGAH